MSSEPNGSFNFTADFLAGESCDAGDCLVKDEALGVWRVSTTAHRTSAAARTTAIARTAYGGSIVGKVMYQMSGRVPASMTGLGSGSASWVRTSATGQPERCTPAPGDDIIGKCAADGSMVFQPGVWDSTNISGGGGGATPGGTVGMVQTNDGASGFAGTAHGAVGSVLRQTGATTSAFGQLDLADSDARTGILPLANGGTGQDFSNLTGHSLQVIRVNVGETGLELAAVAAGGANPAGSGSEIQYRLNGTTFGAVSGASSNGTKIDFSADPTWTKAGQVGTLAWTPTGTRTATMFDATDTIVGKATTDTLTNKTYDIAGTGNVLTATGAAAGGIPIHNGTKYVNTTKGANSTVLTTSSGGTVSWSTVTTAMFSPGTAGQFLTTTSGPTTTWGNAATFYGVGTSTLSSTGGVRFPSGAQVLVGQLNSGGTSDLNVIAADGINGLYFGTDTAFTAAKQASQVNMYAASVVAIGCGGSTYLYMLGNKVEVWQPVGGSSTGSVPFRFSESTVNMSGGASTFTATAAQYANPIHDCTLLASSANYVLPSSAGAVFFIINRGTSAPTTLTIKPGTLGIANGSGQWVKYDASTSTYKATSGPITGY